MEQQERAPERIIRVIQALFNTANRAKGNDGASNEAEATAAMAKAQELLAKYNLDLAMVGSTHIFGSASTVEEPRKEHRAARTAQYRWQVKLMKTICEANFCWHWVQEVYEDKRWNRHGMQKLSKPQRMKRHVILGSEANRIVVEMMYGYLIDTIENILPYPNTDRLSRSAQSWREGCVDRLCERIEEKAEKMKQVDPNQNTEAQTSAIVLRSVYDSEYAKNYDARYGEGAYAQMKANEAKRKAEREEDLREYRAQKETALALVKELTDQGSIDADTSWEELMGYLGEFREDIKEFVANHLGRQKMETEEERKERERSERDTERWWQSYQRKQQREAERIDRSAYRAGTAKGNEINLDSQLNRGKEQKQL